MKLKEIVLLEFKETLDRTVYGAWLDPNLNLHEVQREGHYDWMMPYLKQNVPQEQISAATNEHGMMDGVNHLAFNLGFIKFTHPPMGKRPSPTIQVDGLGQSIKRATNIIMQSAVQPNVKKIFILWH